MINALGINPFDRLNQVKEQADLKSQVSKLMTQLKSAQTKESKAQISNQLETLAQASGQSLTQLGADTSSIFSQQAKPALVATNTNANPIANAEETGATAFTNEEQVQQDNAAALKGLDTGAKTILEQAAESTNNNEKQFESIAQKLNVSGYEATVVESDHINETGTTKAGEKTKYLEIKDKNGNVTRIWDSNGNGTLEAADFNTNTYLKEFANDLKAAKLDLAGVTDKAALDAADETNKKDKLDKEEKLEKLEAANDAGGK